MTNTRDCDACFQHYLFTIMANDGFQRDLGVWGIAGDLIRSAGDSPGPLCTEVL